MSKPIFDREPDFINSIGTKFWGLKDFDDIIETLPIEDVTVSFSEHMDEDGTEYWGFIIIEGDTVLFETPHYEDILEILKEVKRESVERGYISE